MVNMKIFLSVLLAIAVIGCIFLGISAAGLRGEIDHARTQQAAAESQLAGVQNELAIANSDLVHLQKDLTAIEADLSTATDELTAAESELAQTKFDLTDANHRLDIASSKNTQMLDNYTSLRETIYRRLGFDEDSESFITPDDPAVIAKVKEIAGAFSEDSNERWRDYRRMYDWVVDNIDYSSDTNLPILPTAPDGSLRWMSEYWKMPSETLVDGTGDCEDMTGLLASLMLSYNNQKYAVWAVIIRDNDGNGHVAVAYPVTGDELTILDPAGNYYTGYLSGSLHSDDISVAVSDWLYNWSAEMPGAEVTAAFSNDFYEEFSGTREFITWAINKYAD